MDANTHWNRYRGKYHNINIFNSHIYYLVCLDSQRYVDMENNYMYFKCRSVADYKGGAAGDKVDRDHSQP